MKSKFKIAIIGLTVLLVGCCYLYLEFYNSHKKDMQTANTDVHIRSNQLAGSFSADEQKANYDYVEKTIEVVGSIEKITKVDNRYTVLLQGEDRASYVMCDLLPSNSKMAEKLRPGQVVRLKGICKGYLMDVILLNCILIKG